MRKRRPNPGGEGPGAEVDARGAQLVQAAQRTLALALEDARDPVLARCRLVAVAPHPDASCLRLVVSAASADVDHVRAALERARSYLRSELADDLDRRRTPEIVFAVVPHEP